VCREIAQNAMKGAIKAITKGVVEEVSGVDFDARGVV
jgi:molybdopterin-binding protein